MARRTGTHPFGDDSTPFVANTAFHQIIQIPVTASRGVLTAGKPSIFITGINASDGIMVNHDDNLDLRQSGA